MNLENLQKWVKDDWDKASKKKPDSHLQLIYLFEELGEVAEAIRKLSGNKARKRIKVDLEEELGDLLIVIATIANNYGIDLNSAVLKSKRKILKRHAGGL